MKLLSKLLLMLSGLLTSVTAIAGDSLTDIKINSEKISSGVFYTQIWFWLIAGLVFMLLIVALLRGDSKG